MTGKQYSESFEKIFGLTRKLSAICGVNVTDEHFKPNWKTVFIIFLINFGVSLSFYTLYLETILAGDHNKFFKIISVVGTAFQGYSKAVTVLKQKKNFRFLYLEIIGMYKTYELKSNSYQMALKYNISLVKKLLGTIFAIMGVTSAIVIGFPIFMLIAFKVRLEILPYRIPFIDTDTDLGYYITSTTQIIVVFFAGFGNFLSDSWQFTYTAHIAMLKNILKCKFDDLDEISNAYPKDIKKTIYPLIDILKWHQKYIYFCDTIKNTFFWVIFVQVSTEFLGIVCTIICMFLGIWPPAPVFAFYLFSLFYTFCALGNLVEAANTDIVTMIYDSCWYNLTVPEQKMILYMLRESQQATGISIGGIAPLTLNTALQFTKTIYTFTMMLKEFFMD